MEVFTKLNAVEDEVFQEMEKIDKQIIELKVKQRKLNQLANIMNHERVIKLRTQVDKK